MEPVDSSQVGLDDAHHVLEKPQSEVFHREKGMNQIDQLDIPPSSFEVGINEGMLSVTGASFEKEKGHRSLASVTNANAEGVGAIERILSEARRLQEEEETTLTLESMAISPGKRRKSNVLSPAMSATKKHV